MLHICVPFACEDVDCLCLQCFTNAVPISSHIHISQDGCTALYLAAQEGHEEIVELLLEAKADLKLKMKVIILMNN